MNQLYIHQKVPIANAILGTWSHTRSSAFMYGFKKAFINLNIGKRFFLNLISIY
jgi:hypothetical protein